MENRREYKFRLDFAGTPVLVEGYLIAMNTFNRKGRPVPVDLAAVPHLDMAVVLHTFASGATRIEMAWRTSSWSETGILVVNQGRKPGVLGRWDRWDGDALWHVAPGERHRPGVNYVLTIRKPETFGPSDNEQLREAARMAEARRRAAIDDMWALLKRHQ